MKTRKMFQLNFAPYFRNVRRSTAWAMLCLALCALIGLGLSARAQELITAITFEAPWAATGEWQGTQGFQINPAGATVGVYSDSDNVYHGFLRAPNGEFTTIDDPYAGNTKDVTGLFQNMFLWEGQGTYALGINPAGAVTGFYLDGGNLAHGFLRTPDRKFTTIDAPSEYVGTGFGQGTYAANINPAGVIAGNTVDSSYAAHTFLLAPGGTFTMATFRARAVEAGRAHGPGGPNTSALRAHFQGGTLTGTMWLTATCGPMPAPSLPSMLPARARPKALSRERMPGPSTRRGRPLESTLTRAMWVTALCALLTAPSLRSTFGARANPPARAPYP